MAQPKLLFLINTLRGLFTHRIELAQTLVKAGYEVHVASPLHPRIHELEAMGITHHVIPMSRRGLNIFQEFISLISIIKLLQRLKPDILHLLTIKPIVYGGIAARLTKVPFVVAAVVGLGYVFTANTLMVKLQRFVIVNIYKWAFYRRAVKIIFQNTYDQELFLNHNIITPQQNVLFLGSGVNLQKFNYVAEPEGIITIIMVARLLWHKGVREFIEAADIIIAKGIRAKFLLIGDQDKGNPVTVPDDFLQNCLEKDYIEIHDFRDDIHLLYQQSHIAVLPSYREGMPKVLLEAAACGRPIVTTDVPGCNQCVIPDKTGFVVPVKDSQKLAEAITTLILDAKLRNSMGWAARQLAEQRFSLDYIINQHLTLYQTRKINDEISDNVGGLAIHQE